jgi:hypothetical protein
MGRFGFEVSQVRKSGPGAPGFVGVGRKGLIGVSVLLGLDGRDYGGLWDPILATKTRTSRGWGTQFFGGAHFLWWSCELGGLGLRYPMSPKPGDTGHPAMTVPTVPGVDYPYRARRWLCLP